MSKKRLAIVISVLFVFFLFVPIFKNEAEETVFNHLLPEEGAVAVDFGGEIPIDSSKSAIVIDSESLSVLYSKNPDERLGMASTTKIMTALVAIENSHPDDEFIIPKEAVGIEGSSVYLKEGEVLTIRELLYCLLLESGNDSAVAIALFCGKSIENFAKMMNDRADELGLENTHFVNPHGLSDDNHYTTARELAIITAEAMKYPLFCEISATKSIKVRYDGVENGRHLVNHNKLLGNYDGATGGKTGYTKKDGKCLVSSAEKDGLEIIAVTLGDGSPVSTHTILLDSAFENYEKVNLVGSGDLKFEIPVIDGEDAFLTVENEKGANVCLPKNTKAEAEIILPKSVNAPIKKGEVVGKVVYRYKGEQIYIINLLSTENINTKRKSFFEIIFEKQ